MSEPTDFEDLPEPLQPSYDPDTLREVWADERAVREQIALLRLRIAGAPDDIAELMDRGELVGLLRSVGDLDDALAQARLALERAELVGTPAQQHTARLRLAHVLQWQGEFGTSDALFAQLSADAPAFGPIIVAFTHQHAGKNDYDQGRFAAAADHFAAALSIRTEFELPADQVASSTQALDAARRRQSGDGAAS